MDDCVISCWHRMPVAHQCESRHINQLRTACGLSSPQFLFTSSEHHMLAQPTVSLIKSHNGVADVLLGQHINQENGICTKKCGLRSGKIWWTSSPITNQLTAHIAQNSAISSKSCLLPQCLSYKITMHILVVRLLQGFCSKSFSTFC